jgi:limonene-1,2-epoxide hydrolase
MSCVPRPCPTAAATALAALAVLAGASGCGQARHVVRDVVTPAPPVDASPAPGLDPHVLPPARIPRHASQPAAPAARHVIEAWLRALRAGHLRQAARYFAVPTTFQNATPVLHLDSEREVRAVVASFPCGAVATRFAASGRYTLVRFRLTERVGGDCHGAAGHTTGGAIRVAGGRIREWYRLYDPEEIHPTGPLVDPGRLAA